jgi:hypothetical protein
MELNNFTAPSSYPYGSAQMPPEEARDRRVTHGRPQPVSARDLFFDRRLAGGVSSCDHGVLRPPRLAASFTSAPSTDHSIDAASSPRRGQSPAFHVRTRRASSRKCVAIIRSAVTPSGAAQLLKVHHCRCNFGAWETSTESHRDAAFSKPAPFVLEPAQLMGLNRPCPIVWRKKGHIGVA